MRYLGENVPNTRPFSILVPGAFNLSELQLISGHFGWGESYLVGGCCTAPAEVVREGVKEQRLFWTVSKSYRAQEEDYPDHPPRQSKLTWSNTLSWDNSNRETVHFAPKGKTTTIPVICISFCFYPSPVQCVQVQKDRNQAFNNLSYFQTLLYQ